MQHDTCHDALESELGSRAKVNFANLLEKAGLCPQAPSRNWHFAESVAAIEPHIATACSLQLQFLQNLQRNWRPSHSEKFQLPDEWKPKAEDRTCAIRPAEFFDPFALHLFLESLSDHVSFLSHAEVVNRHLDPTSCKPDFLLFTRHRLVEHDEDYSTLINPPETAFTCNARVLLSYFKDVVTCEGDELSAEYSIPGIFTSTPGCWLRCNPEFDFPPPFGTPRSFPPVDFAVLFHPIGPSRRFSFGRDQHLRMDVLHPALVLGVKGPVPWPDSSNDEPSSSLDEILHNLALSIQPNLDTHLLNWFLLCEQAETPSHNCLALPPGWSYLGWYMMLNAFAWWHIFPLSRLPRLSL
ncbi:hypothetical protein A0H81_12886 [Grifola frondosa]|uniref:Uncharacterized protein n=1 Tax=Grifola frondosa TaxID=5627 RepID=A0A1C7LSJ1_GRIFR|nr:hypothetical protein A0H81_12886 [Grifola frondosa]